MSRPLPTIALILATSFLTLPASAASIYLHTPTIIGENSTPGFPGAMNLHSLTIAPEAFSITRHVDSASPQLQAAVVGGTPILSTQALFYDAAIPSGPPDAVLPFQNVLATTYTPPGVLEQVDFAATTPGAIYLEVPGITGESSTPGHPDVMQVQSVTLTGTDFTITKAVDSASPQILSAIALGTHFPTASLLFYNNSVPGPQPDQTIVLHTVLASSQTLTPAGGAEQDTFIYQSLTPEPATGALALVSIAAITRRRRRGARRTTDNEQLATNN